MKKYKLIAIDIDGTLLTNDKKILIETKKDITDAYNRGRIICICTGRGYPAAKRYVDELDLNIPLILYNGSRVRMSKDPKVLFNQVIDELVAKNVYDIINRHDGTCCFWKEDTLYFNKNDKYALYYEDLTKVKPNFITDIYDGLFENINKFIWFADSEFLEIVQQEILNDVVGIDYFKSNTELLEIVPENVNKGNTLKYLGESLGIIQEEIIAVGDEANDLSMIKFAGMGVAMGNAKDIVKENAQYITLSNEENGVGEVIKKFM